MSKASAQIIVNEPQMGRAGVCVCDVPLPSRAVSTEHQSWACRSLWAVLCSHCATGTRYSLLLQGLAQREHEGQQSSRLSNVPIQGARCPDSVLNQETPGLRRASWSTAMHIDSTGEIPDQEYLYPSHREILVQRVLVVCLVRLETKEPG